MITSLLSSLLALIIIVVVILDNNNNNNNFVAAQNYQAGFAVGYKIATGTTMTPRQASYDPFNDIFVIAMTGTNMIYTWDTNANTVTRIAGNGAIGQADKPNPLQATFNNPYGVTNLFDSSNVHIGYLISDSLNSL